MDFSDILSEMGIDSDYNFGYIPVTEKQLESFNDSERGVDACKIPYYFHADKRVMTEALKYLTGYSYYCADNPQSQSAAFHDYCITNIAEMVEQDNCKRNNEPFEPSQKH